MKNISVITITYNSSKNLIGMIESIHNAQFAKEIIIVENASPDAIETEKIVNKLKAKIHNIKFIKSKTNLGFGKACNLGFKKSTGRYQLFINPDTIINPFSVATLLEHLTKNSADIAGGKMIGNYGKAHGSFVRKPNLTIALFEFSNLGKIFGTSIGHDYFYYADKNYRTDSIVDAVSGGYLLAKREAFEKLGGFDERFFMYLEDVDLGVRAKNSSLKVIYCPHSVIFHEGGASSKNPDRIRHSAWFDSRRKYCLKHFSFFENIIIQPIFLFEEIMLKFLKHL